MNDTPIEWRPEWTADEEKDVAVAVVSLKQAVSVLRALRQQLGLSQAELSAILGTSQSNISKLEAKAEPQLSVIRRLVEHKGGRLKLVAEFADSELELTI